MAYGVGVDTQHIPDVEQQRLDAGDALGDAGLFVLGLAFPVGQAALQGGLGEGDGAVWAAQLAARSLVGSLVGSVAVVWSLMRVTFLSCSFWRVRRSMNVLGSFLGVEGPAKLATLQIRSTCLCEG